ncbi:MAG: VWA domain-containing protein [Pirellula sp.]
MSTTTWPLYCERGRTSAWKRQYRSRRGNVLFFVVFTAVALMFFGAMAINFVWFDFSEEKLQHTADSAAISATYALLLESDNLQPETIANRVAQDFEILNKKQDIEKSDTVFGKSTRNSSGKFIFQAGTKPFNSVRVTAKRQGGHKTGALPVFFRNLLGVTSVNMTCSATAVYLEQDLAIVVDASGFMHGPDRFDEAARGFKVVMDELETRNRKPRVSLTLFSKDGDTIQSVTDNLDLVRDAFDNIFLRGPSDIERGLIEGLRSVFTASNAKLDTMKDVILFSECKENKAKPNEITELAEQLGARIHVFTFSKVADTVLAKDIASATGGEHNHQASNAQIANFVDRVLNNSKVLLCE